MVALCQIEVVPGDREGNFARIRTGLQEASAQGADLAVSPESSILGWINPDAHALAHPIPGEDTDRLCKLAREFELGLIIGLDEKDGDALYGSA